MTETSANQLSVQSTQSPAESPASEKYTARSGPIVGVLAFSGIVAAVMQTLVVPLIGEMPELLGTSASNATWVVTATLLAAAVCTPITGRLGDLYGKKPVMLACSLLLVAGSVVCALATALIPMIVGRSLQGAAMGLVPLGISAMRDLLPPEKLGTSIALMSASMGIGGALGLPIAAAVAEYSTWHALFWGATALAVMVAAFICFFLPATPVTAHGKFDPAGAAGLGIGLVCLLLGVSKGADWGWTSGLTLGLLVASVLVFLAWGWFQLRTSDPLVDLRVTARPVVLLTNLSSVVIGFAMYAQSLIVPQLLQLPTETGYGLGQNMFQMGLWMAPGGVMMMMIAPVGARISYSRGPKITLAIGAAVMAAGYLAAVALMGSTWGLLVSVCITNVGVGFAYGAMPALIMGSVKSSETGAANSLNTLMRSIGTSVSAAVVGVVLANMTTDFFGLSLPSEAGFHTGLLIGAAVAIVAAIIALLIPSPATKKSDAISDHAAREETGTADTASMHP
ncbi:MFS transporter [Paenarthrobacter sp. NPDC091669]|uniref:MFS transporter n=1 Tax=Paenarthrobacter sp. NPDC091669 TaxID=3364384 RepID=UPI003821EC38